MESEKDILDCVRAGKLALPPLSFSLLNQSTQQSYLLLEASWQDKRYKFAGVAKRYGSDKSVREAGEQARRYSQALRAHSLVIVPWLSTEQLLYLEQSGISGVDLCGNGVIVIPGKLLVFRNGEPNKFPTSRLVRRIYEGTSSLVARVFLLRPEYGSVSEILEEITARGGNITLPTVSKALKQLEEDVVIEKSKEQIRLLQPDKLLDRLKANYQQPKIRDLVRCKLTTNQDANIRTVLCKAAKQADAKLVLTGESSVNFYAAMANEPIDTFYCTEYTTLRLEKFGASMDVFSRFPNVELRKTEIETVYFDMRCESGYNIASPIQAFLELSKSDPRGQKTAEEIRQQILDALAKPKRRRSK